MVTSRKINRYFNTGFIHELNKNNNIMSNDKNVSGKHFISGMTLDCARRYYPVKTIKQLIDVLAEHGSFLQLHLSDDQNVGVECAFLKQTEEDARLLADGSYWNPQTGKRFLTAKQIKDVIQYAKQRGIDIVPEIDTPAHMSGFFALADYAFGGDYVETIAYARYDYPGELNVSSTRAVQFVQRLYDEYADLFKDCHYFHIGCDEHFSGTLPDKTAYIMTLSSYMRQKGFIVRMWNDLMTKTNISRLDKSIQVTYWSWDGDALDENVRARRQEERASVPDLQKEGFDLLIYNSYYLYYVPSFRNFNEHDNDYTVNDLRNNWTIRNWYKNSGMVLDHLDHVIGSAVSMWGEDSIELPEETIVAQFIRQYRAMEWVNQREMKD